MKNRIWTNSIRNIKKAFPRFLSLIIMSGLGVFAFAGLQATAPDMITTLDNSLDQGNVYDIRIVSDMGLTEEDVSAVEELDGVKEAEGACSKDVVVVCDGEDKAVRLASLPENINLAELTSGRLPMQADEIVVEERMLSGTSLQLGDTVVLEDEDSFAENTVTIVGTVDEPMYFNNASFRGDRGTTSVGSGTINYYAYMPVENFTQDYLSVMYVTVEGASEEITSYDSYAALVQTVEDELEALASSREDARYEQIRADGESEIDDARADADEELADAKSELADAKQKLDDGSDELSEALQKIADAENELKDGKAELDSSWSELMKNQAKLKDAEAALAEGKAEYQDALAEAGISEAEIDSTEEALEEGIQTGESGLKQIEDGLDQVETGLGQAEENQTKLTAGLTAAEQGLTEIADGLKTIEESLPQIEAGLEQIEEKEQELNPGLDTVNAGLSQINSEIEALDGKIAGADSGIKTLDGKISDAESRIKALESQIAETDSDINSAEQGNETESDISSLEQKKSEMESEISSLKQQIEGWKEQKAETEQTKAGLESSREKLTEQKSELDTQKSTLNAQADALAAKKKELTDQRDALTKKQEELQEKQAEVLTQKETMESQQSDLAEMLATLKAKQTELEDQKASVEAQLETAKTQLKGVKQLASARDRLKASEKELEAGRQTLADAFTAYDEGQDEYNNGLSELTDAKKTYRDSEKEYEEKRTEYEDGLAEYKDAEKDADQKIADARKELDEVEHPTWYIYDRTDDSTYQDYIDDSNSISNLSKIFPVVFFLVAVLVSLISMNRMVEDDRLEIGTLKSLGFETRQIMGKYVLFAALATVIGGIIGAALGLYIIPNLINGIYKILFDVPDFVLLPRWGTTLTGFAITVVCVCGTSIFTAWQVLREKPSELMRPKAPKGGKRVFLENIPGLWHRLKFSQKVTVRNLFRYKKRVMVTVGGIAGCTALMLTGFGIRDAIQDIAAVQYETIWQFDGTAYVSGLSDKDEGPEDTEQDPAAVSSENPEEEDKETAGKSVAGTVTEDSTEEVIWKTKLDKIFGIPEISEYTPTERVTAELGDLSVYLCVTADDEALMQIASLKDADTGEPLHLQPGEVIITEKMSALTGLEAGDTVSVVDTDHNAYSWKISGVATNYIEHYIFMDEETFGEFSEWEPNVVYFNTGSASGSTKADHSGTSETDISDSTQANASDSAQAETSDGAAELSEVEQDELSGKLLADEDVLYVSYKDRLIESVNNTLQSLNKVVLILIVLASMLSFVVLYNLSNINISERRREIASLKVLGFYDKEVDSYITRENIILTAFGIVIGLFIGRFLSHIVVATVEVEKCRFINVLQIRSYLYSAAMAVLFTWIVNVITHFNLRRIDMVDSLKSVE